MSWHYKSFHSVFSSPGFLTAAKLSYRAASVSNTTPRLYPNLEDCVLPWQSNAVLVVYTLSPAKHQYNPFGWENTDILKTIKKKPASTNTGYLLQVP